jgi:hypothetical protein
MAKQESKKRGPPPTEQGKPVVVRCRRALLKQLDDWRRQQDDIPSRPEAIRRLIAQALKK